LNKSIDKKTRASAEKFAELFSKLPIDLQEAAYNTINGMVLFNDFLTLNDKTKNPEQN
jgi:hypothetical protein